MPALNFQKQFASTVESGKKRQTIRALRKDGRDPALGETLALYTGMRTRACRKLLDTVCRSVQPVKIFRSMGILTITVDGNLLSDANLHKLALADGFASSGDFLQFFLDNHGLPFNGLLIKW